MNVLAAVPRTLGLLRAHMLARDPSLAAEIGEAAGQRLGRRGWRFRRVHRALGLRFWAAVCGGATLPEELERFWTTLGFALVQGYGLTETSALVTLNHPFQTTRGSLGKPLPGRELRLSANGELEVRGEMVATASWREGRLVRWGGVYQAEQAEQARQTGQTERAEQPGQAEQTGQGERPGQGEWLRTGDLAAFDADGRVRFLGRTGQRLVTAAGLNVYLQDVEQVLEWQTKLEGAVVLEWQTELEGGVALALPDGAGGEEPAAVVLARARRAAVARANGLLAAHQQVRRWWLWPGLELPRTATGKVRRGVVESWAREQGGLAGEPVAGEKNEGSDASDLRGSLDPSDRLDPLLALLELVSTRRAGGRRRAAGGGLGAGQHGPGGAGGGAGGAAGAAAERRAGVGAADAGRSAGAGGRAAGVGSGGARPGAA